ncbi:MAG: hypothetical protein CVU06_04385 [Bacteroidetes bacterium HGW-Bacteroidetes-22]|nr:MAG: hypothetical protein CVU06_04385 [Bacteroidetes bacterium HGW-Bacteroidetes-22]
MEQALAISAVERNDVLTISVEGRIDSYRAGQLDQFVEEKIHNGKYHLSFDLTETNYISSTGIRIFVKYYKQLKTLNGALSITNASAGVKEVFRMVGMSKLFEEYTPAPVVEKKQEQWVVNARDLKIAYKVYEPGKGMKLSLYGRPDAIRRSDFSAIDSRHIEFGGHKYGLGLGAFGPGFNDCADRFGEFLAVGNVVVCQPTDTNRPDFMAASGDLIPAAELLYGLVAEGGFGHTLRFESTDGHSVKLGTLLRYIGEELKTDHFFMVMLAESNGVVGVALKKSPVNCQDGTSPFSFPDLRHQVYYTTEPDHIGTLMLCAGVVSIKPDDELRPFVRPLDSTASLTSHFHGAVFPFHLL